MIIKYFCDKGSNVIPFTDTYLNFQERAHGIRPAGECDPHSISNPGRVRH